MCNQFFTPDPRALKAIEEHTRLHTEALREENERLREAIKTALDKINIGNKNDARTALKQALKGEKP